MRDLKWLSLNDVKKSIPAMDRQGVSKVARGVDPSSQTKEGWVQAYIATGGNPVAMSQRLTGRNDHETWKDRRKQFLARHLEKVRRDNEPLWRNGEPTRRHLALVAWGYSPTISRLQKWLKTQPSLASGEWKKGVKILKQNPNTQNIYGRTEVTDLLKTHKKIIFQTELIFDEKVIGDIDIHIYPFKPTVRDIESGKVLSGIEPNVNAFKKCMSAISRNFEDTNYYAYVVWARIKRKYRGKGWGKILYITAIEELKAYLQEPFVFMSERCGGGFTSEEAHYIWNSLLNMNVYPFVKSDSGAVEQDTTGMSIPAETISLFISNPQTPTKSQSDLYFENYDLYSDRDPTDTISIQYSTMDELKNTIAKLENLYKTNQYSHARIVQVANVLKQRLRVIYDNTGKAKDRYDLATDYFKFLTSQRTPLARKERKSLVFRKNGAPGYQSYGWTTQDWRSIFLHSDGSVSYEKKCGAKGTQLPSGKPRLCLPLYVIKKLLKTKSGKEILIKQARKKQRAKKGQRIPWHPKIKELHSKLEARTPKDDPKLRKNPNTLSQFFLDRNIPAVMTDNVLVVRPDQNSLALLQDYSEFLGIEIHPMIDEEYIHIHSDNWDETFLGLHQLFS